MNRLQKKCYIASAGFHLLLLAILFIGPAFFTSDNKKDTMVVDFVPSKLVDSAVMGGGNPNGRPPTPAPLPIPPQVTPPLPAPVKASLPEPPKPIEPNHDAIESRPDGKRKPNISTTLVTRPHNTTTTSKTPSANDTRAEANRLAREIGRITTAIRNNTSTGVSIEPLGPGGGGETYANYDAWIRTVYQQAWIEPEGVSGNITTPKASITIARDGTVVLARITQYSGNALVDGAVQAVLDRVKSIAPFPEGSRDDQRTYTINFELNARKTF